MFLSLSLLLGTLFNAASTVAAAEIEPPKNLRVVEGSITHNSVKVEWDFIGDDEHPNDIQFYNADTKQYMTWGNRWTRTVGGLSPETTYRIYIVWDSKPTTVSNVIEFTTTEDTQEYKEAPLPAPLNFQVTDVTASTVSFKWLGSPGADAYDMYMNGGWAGGVWDGSNTYTYTLKDNEKIAGTELAFQVAAQKSVPDQPLAVSRNSNTIKLTWGELATPGGVQVVTANLTTAVIGWAPVSGATSYNVYKDGKLAGTTSDNRYTATELQEGKSYSYTVEAINPLWKSAASDAVVVVPGANYTNVSYYAGWSVGARQFFPEDVDVTKITHLNYAFADICWNKFGTTTTACQTEDIPLQNRYVYNGEIVLGDHKEDVGSLQKFADMKSINPDYKLLVSVGGWSWSKWFSDVADDELARRTFAMSIVDFIREYELDGIDIDWEYPVEGGETHNIHRPTDKENFTVLMQTVRAALDAAGSEDGKYYLLTIASGQGDNFVVNADLVNSSKYIDFINIMTYDYGGSWETIANHNSPLYYDPELPKPTGKRNNVLGGVNGHLTAIPDHKLVLGLPFYGKAWSGCDVAGEYSECTDYPAGSWEKGIYDYSDIISFIGKDGYERHWNEYAKVPYLTKEDIDKETGEKTYTFITYNDLTTMRYSASLVKSRNLAGVMSWDISGDRTYGLLTQLNADLPSNGVVNKNALAAPKGLALTKANYGSVTVKWDSVAGATGYEAYIDGMYAGSTDKNEISIDNLASGSSYNVHVLAITEAADIVTQVSPTSSVLAVKTLALAGGGGGGGGDVGAVTPPSNQQELTSTVEKKDDAWVVTVDKDGAISIINGSTNTSFTLTVDPAAPSAIVNLPKEVVAALVAAGADAELKLVWNGVTYVLPAKGLDQSADIRIVLQPRNQQSVGSTIMPGVSALTGAIGFTVEAKGEDGEYHAIDHKGSTKLSIALPANSTEESLVKGIVYAPGSNTFRLVTTKVVKKADGSLTVELDASTESTYVIVEASFNYQDNKLPWANDAIKRASDRLIVFGESANHFGTASKITRAEFVSIVVRGLGLLPNEATLNFNDVDSKSFYAEDIAIASTLGLITGKEPGKFDPNGSITRQEMAVVLYRALTLSNGLETVQNGVLDRFSDKGKVPTYAIKAIEQLISQNILNGVSATRFAPQGDVTKAQAVVAIMRLLDGLEK